MELLTRLMADPKVAAVFNRQQLVLNHSLPLSCYLLKPVQRILKYQLLLQVLLHRYTSVIMLYMCFFDMRQSDVSGSSQFLFHFVSLVISLLLIHIVLYFSDRHSLSYTTYPSHPLVFQFFSFHSQSELKLTCLMTNSLHRG